MSNHTKFLGHVTLISWIFSKFSPVVGIIEIQKCWKYYPLTPSNSEFMVLLINNKIVCLGWHFKYYFFFDNFCFKQSVVLKTHWGMFFNSRNSKLTSKLPSNLLLLSYRKIISKFTIQYISVKEKYVAL